MAKILLVEDDCELSETVKEWLEAEQFSVESSNNGSEAYNLLRHYDYDLCILDWDLPERSGIEILHALRSEQRQVPVLFLTAKRTASDKEKGFLAGADDYLTKPFKMQELVLRIRAILRRCAADKSKVLICGEIRMDSASGQVTVNGQEIKLPPAEHALLDFLLRHPNHLFSADDLLNHVWRSDSDATFTALRTSISRLRKRLESCGNGSRIESVYGLGYKFVPIKDTK